MGFFCVVISLLAEPEGLLSFLSEEVGLRELEDMTPASCLLVAHQKIFEKPICGFCVFQRSFFLCVGGML